MPIKLLRISNFKSIKHLRLRCRRVNLFIGEPNTGKSNILEAIGLLSHVFHGRLNKFLRFEVLTDLFYDNILDEDIRINFNNEGLQVTFKDGEFRGSFIEPTRSIPVFTYDYYGEGSCKKISGFSAFKFYRFVKRTDFPNQQSEFLMPPDGDNLLAVVTTRKELRRIVKDIFGKFGYRPVYRLQEGKIEIQKELEDIIFAFPYSLASDTLQRLVFYLAAMHSNKGSVLTFEEPEAHAFPYYTKYLAERIALDNNQNQYFIATHNPYFLISVLEKAPKAEVAVFATSLENYQTKAKPLTEKQKEEILEMGSDVFFNIERLLG
jgi:AAA15 family ATPase/GTPase